MQVKTVPILSQVNLVLLEERSKLGRNKELGLREVNILRLLSNRATVEIRQSNKLSCVQ
jgi:hypothetical protein